MSERAISDDDGGGHPRVLVSTRLSSASGRSIDEGALAGLAADTLIAEGFDRAELSLSFVEEDEIAELHERYLHEPGPTDVLSFPLDDDAVDEHGVRLLGDVVIAPSVAARTNPDDPGTELRLLVVHGVLHLIGYDHETDADRGRMWTRQERYSGVVVP
jgi:probable rRNA maturation factor